MNNTNVLDKIRRGLIVSCQALENEPLHSSFIMGRMAKAAMEGGAKGIRANTVSDILEIKKQVDLPVIGIIKAEYTDSPVYITPTIIEVEALVEVGVDIIALDATQRPRPMGKSLAEFFGEIKEKFPNQLFMADCSCFEDCKNAEKLGFDIVATTLCGYTEETKGIKIPNFQLIERITNEIEVPIIAEGGIWSPEELKKIFEYKVFAAVVGSAITRPQEITKKYTEHLS